MAKTEQWNPRYVHFARVHGHEPEEQREHDREAWPGGSATGFILWMGSRWREWARQAGHDRARDPNAFLDDNDHKAFDEWLAKLPVGHKTEERSRKK